VNPAAAPSYTPMTAPSRADRWIDRAAAATVAGLAGIAGAISYSHMRQLAAAHGDAGWHAHAFPLSVDGVKIVASLVLLAGRRAGRRSGWLPWTALAVGTAASLGANVATADAGTVSRIIAGWPALALLISVKLLSGILEHRPDAVPHLPADPDLDGCNGEARALHEQTVPVPPMRADMAGNAHPRESGRPRARDSAASRPVPANTASQQPSSPRRTVAATAAEPGWLGAAHPFRAGTPAGTLPDLDADIAALLPAARAARDELRTEGYPLTRDTLASRLRQAGHPVRNARLTPLLQALRGEPASLSLNGH